MSVSTTNDINKRLINNDALFNNIHVIHQTFDIIPGEKKHYGVSIEYQDLYELREDFLNQLYDTIVDWVYSSEKYKQIKDAVIRSGKTEQAAYSEIHRKARDKFRGNRDSKNLLIQGQLGELLLFHFIQRFQKATPLLRKMKITTSNKHERFGADAIHLKFEDSKPVIILGEAKTYTSDYKFKKAFEDALDSILTTYSEHRKELHLYLHEDFLDDEMNEIAEKYLTNTLKDFEVQLVSIVVYNETEKINLTNRADIIAQIDDIIKQRYESFENNKIDTDKKPILKRITYIVMPVWELEKLAEDFQNKI